MATPLNGTVIVTGAAGSLGSKIAWKIAQRHPFVHLLLAVRDVSSKDVLRLSQGLKSIGPRSFEVAPLDLTSFHSIRSFADDVLRRVQIGDLPMVQLLINCAAVASFKVDAPTEDGFDLVYQTNCLGPLLLTVNLLEAFRAHRGGNGARVINMGCSLMSMGKLDFFESHTMSSKKLDSSLSVREGLVRFGSSKLLLNAAMYALRRNLALTSGIILTVFTLDPGRLANRRSKLIARLPFPLRVTNGMVGSIRPFTHVFAPKTVSSPSKSADAIVKVAFDPLRHDNIGDEKYFLLDEERNVKDTVQVTNNHKFMGVFLRQAIVDIGITAADDDKSA